MGFIKEPIRSMVCWHIYERFIFVVVDGMISREVIFFSLFTFIL